MSQLSHAHRGALAIAIVASIATSAPPPAWYAAQQVEMTSITLNDEENIYPLEVHLNADDALLSGDVYYNTQKLTLNVENYIHASTNISMPPGMVVICPRALSCSPKAGHAAPSPISLEKTRST